MAIQYWIGGFFIDLSRNQITQNEQSQILAPKAMAVLTYLAENQGKVVSQDELLAKVWQGTAVTPNTLQKSIAQLRKALGDDGKGQIYIKTHAKQGYSLECDVRWHDSLHDSSKSSLIEASKIQEAAVEDTAVDKQTDGTSKASSDTKHNIDTDIEMKQGPALPSLTLISILSGIIILGVLGYRYLAPKPTSEMKDKAPEQVTTNITPAQSSPLTFDTLRSLTATDDKEFDATYSPDGKYIVFHRYREKACVNKLWAKNISTQQEFPLTKDWGAYGKHSFSEDGKKLVFLATEPCNEPVTQLNCYDLVSLDFDKALEAPLQPSLILECKNSKIRAPSWLGNDDIALLQNKSRRWKLINYSISQNQSTDLYSSNDSNVIDFDYSPKDDLIALTSIHSDGQHYIEMLKPDGRILSSNKIEYPKEISKSSLIFPSFDPLNDQLVFSTGKQFFTLSYDGKVAKVNVLFTDRMIQPEFHPDGKKILFIKGPYDSDIVRLSLNQITSSLEQANQTQTETYPSFERSNLGEDSAMFQPEGDLIAFWSRRSGEEQLWITDGNAPQLLTHFPTDTYIRGIDWAADGKSLLVNANYSLTQVFLDSSTKSFPTLYPVVKLYQWDSKNNSALLLIRKEGILKFVEYDFNNSTIKEINNGNVKWALKSEDGRLIYKDHMDQFWQPGAVEDQRITQLEKQGGRAEIFVINNNVIYAINNEHQLWSYDLNSEAFNILGEVSEDVDYLTDINQTQLLMTIKVSAKKEVVELSLSK